MLFDLMNLPYWILLAAGVVLFLFVILSGGGDDDVDLDAGGDFDLDGDVDLDLDGDGLLELDTDTDADFSAVQVLGWFGLGKAPLVLLIALDLCLWGLLGWMLNVTIAEAIAAIPPAPWNILILATSGLVTLIIGGQIARPLGKIFASFSEDASDDRLIGCVGSVTSASVPESNTSKIGQADVFDAANNLVTISVVRPPWANISLRRGAKVLVIERQGRLYHVIAKDSPDQEHWLANRATP